MSNDNASSLRTKFIQIFLNYWTIYRCFEIILEGELSIGLEFKSNVLCKSIALKTFNLIWIIFFEILCFKNIQSDMNYIFWNIKKLIGVRLLSGIFGKKRLNACGFAREFLWSGMLYRPGKSLKRRAKFSSLHSKKTFCLGCVVFLWVKS